jgi:hypothetical protein
LSLESLPSLQSFSTSSVYRMHVRSMILGFGLLAWLALPIAAELRPPFEWNLPAGTILNADPEPPWETILRGDEATALLQSPWSDHTVLLPEPGSVGAESVPTAAPAPPRAPARSSPLLILHQRRNE